MADHDRPDPPRPLDDFFSPGTTVMVATPALDGFVDARPLTVAGVNGDVLAHLIDASAPWMQSLDEGDHVLLTLSDNRSNDWVSVTGRAHISTDEARIDELWSPMASSFFEQGRDTPDIAVLEVRAEHGQYWSSASGRLGSLLTMVKAAVTDARDSGDHGDLAVGP